MQNSAEEQFTEFVRAHSDSLFRTAYLMTGDYQRAEDVLQSALVRIYQRWPRIDAMASPLAYARKVVLSQASSWWRRRSSRESPMQAGTDRPIDDRADSVAEHDRVWRAVLSLPPRQRAVTVLRYYEDLSEAQIAATLGIAPGTVKSNSHAAMRRLAHLLGEPDGVAALFSEEATS
jgi:RNA polymerase sigma-70 factor (sigma-E family)